jgi:hypothetical protein
MRVQLLPPVPFSSRMEKRLMVWRVTPEVVVRLLCQSGNVHLRVLRGAPVGASVVGTYTDHDRCTICIILQHPSFNPVRDGTEIPEFSGPIFEDTSSYVEHLENEAWHRLVKRKK